MSYETHWESKGVAPCGKCGGDADWSVANRIQPAAWWPLVCAVRSIGKCRQCGASRNAPTKRPLAPTIKRRMITSWVILVAIVPAIVMAALDMRATEEARARNPARFDEWTIRTSAWPDLYGENAMPFSRMKVRHVSLQDVEVDACDYTYGDEQGAKQYCKKFPARLVIARGDVPAKLASGSITSIDRPRARFERYWLGVLGVFVLVIGVHAISSSNYFWRNRRRTT